MESWNGSTDSAQAFDALDAAGLTDGLPVIAPTAARVQQMLQAHGLRARDVVAELQPLCLPATWGDIAANAVMAGCRPEYLPVVGAAVQALAAPELNLLGVVTTTGSAAPVIIVSGPLAEAIGMNSGSNALGPGNRANATIGRAVGLVLRNVAKAVPGEIDMATLGQSAKYGCCFAESEEVQAWPTLRAERGFAAGDTVVTVIACAGSLEIVDSCSVEPADLVRTFAQSMLIAGGVGAQALIGSGEALIVMPPELAQLFTAHGWSKEAVKTAIFEQAVLPVARLSPAVRNRLVGNAGGDPAAMELRVAESPKDIMIVVAGGVGVKAVFMPTWSGATRAVSRRVLAARQAS